MVASHWKHGVEIEDTPFNTMDEVNNVFFVSSLVIGYRFTVGDILSLDVILIVIFRVTIEIDVSRHRRFLAI